VSEDARDTLVQHLGGDAVLIPNGVTVRAYTGTDALPGWPPPGSEVLGFLGRVDEPRKGLPVLLEAFSRLASERPRLRLLVAGPGEADAVEDLVPGSLRDRVTLLGGISEEDKPRMLRSADAFVAPNIGGESFGIVLLEAMAAGVPVIASDLEAFRAVLDDGRAGALFPVGDAAALASVARDLLADPARRAELVERGRAAVHRFDWDVVVRDVLAVYETVARPGRPVLEDRRTRTASR
jgi:phosphatidylinositol alpha-mannosyltransferase